MAVTISGETGGDWAQRTYEAMAPVYDDFTGHYESEAWIADLVKVLECHGLTGKRLLDVGCGTGTSFLPMLAQGWEVTGCDISAGDAGACPRESRRRGAARRRRHARPARVSASSTWSGRWTTRSTTCSARRNWRQALAGMRANLAPTGLLLFDVNELRAYRTFFAETTVVEREGRQLIWRGLASADVPPGSICESQMEVAPGEVLDPPPAPLPRSRGASGAGASRAGVPRRLRSRPRRHSQLSRSSPPTPRRSTSPAPPVRRGAVPAGRL